MGCFLPTPALLTVYSVYIFEKAWWDILTDVGVYDFFGMGMLEAGGWAFIIRVQENITPFAHGYMHTHTHSASYPIAHRKHQHINQRNRLHLSLSLPPRLLGGFSFSLRPSMTAAPWNALPRRWATAGLGVATETKEGQMTTTWIGWYLKRGGLPDMGTGEKTGATEHLRGPSVTTQRLTQVYIITKDSKESYLWFA